MKKYFLFINVVFLIGLLVPGNLMSQDTNAEQEMTPTVIEEGV